MSSNFSSAIKITNLDDFIPQSQSCIKPVKLDNNSQRDDSKKQTLQFDEQSNSYFELTPAGDKKQLQKTQISLSDCLACSGCITSAEEVLVNHQSLDRLLSELQSPNRSDEIWVVTLSSQSRASLAAKYHLSMKDVFQKLVTALKEKIGFNYVLDANWARNFTLLEIEEEFIRRKQAKIEGKAANLPLLASACPGWICYAEKSHEEDIVSLISSTKSPQAVMGSMVKGYFYDRFLKPKGVKLSNLKHITVMPCFDKKLEASRSEFKASDKENQETDLVLTTTELDELLQKYDVDLPKETASPLLTSSQEGTSMDSDGAAATQFIDCDSSTGELRGVSGGSGGYAEHVFRAAAKRLYNVQVDEIKKKQKRNSDFQEFSLKVDGKTVLSFAQAYGFRNIQNIIRKIQHKNPRLRCKYDFVEVMACPSGCNNGGGQLAADVEKVNPRDHLAEVETLYHSVKIDSSSEGGARVQSVLDGYKDWVHGEIGSQNAQSLLHTTYRNKKQMESPALREEW